MNSIRERARALSWTALVCIPAVCGSSRAALITFRVQMDVQAGYGLFDPGQDSLALRGSFNGWSGNAAMLLDPDEDLLYETDLELSPGGYEYKYLIQLQGGGEIWESGIPNRVLQAGGQDQVLDPVWFNDDQTVPLQPRPVEVKFTVDLRQQIERGEFLPGPDQVVALGSAEELGFWAPPVPFLAAEDSGTCYSGWIPFDSLSNYPVYYKFVILQDGDPGQLLWENGSDREFTIDGSEADELPPPLGNGYAEYYTPVVYFDHEEGWSPQTLLAGADLSHLPYLESLGLEFTVDGTPVPALPLFHERGCRILRLRLWHSPAEPWQGLDSTLAHAQRALAEGFRLMLDLHYSDTWADPGHQTPPAAWEGLDVNALADSVNNYTNYVIRRFRDGGALPDYVQIGNEIDGGMLWNTGRVGGEWDTPQQWQQLVQLLGAGVAGVRDSLAAGECPQILLHISPGGNNGACRWFFDGLAQHGGVDFEAIGLSYYPWWHGSLEDLSYNLEDLAPRYGKPLHLVETAYPWTLENFDGTNNFVWNEDQLPDEFPPTPDGQLAFLRHLQSLLEDHPEGAVRSLLYWEPDRIAWPGSHGTPVENLALFDSDAEALPGLDFPLAGIPGAPLIGIRLVGGSQIAVEWDPEPGAAAYRVERAPEAAGPWTAVDETENCEWTGQAAGSRAFYRVRSLD